MKRNIEQTADPILTGEPARRKKYRMLQKMKLEKLRHVFKGRGRLLKSDQFPDLAGVLEFCFGEGDRIDRAGGGLESHPRLIDTVLYRAADSNTIMKHARETILALAPEGFNISLSSCFNYTQNFKEGTYQAKRHHSGKGINVCLSLHKPPRIGNEQFVINLRWSTHNVNLTMDHAHLNSRSVMIDSKDAKAKVHTDISPVQKPGKTWRKITLPDHDWAGLAHNAITPMTHLSMETESEIKDERGQHVSITRTGVAATLVNILHFEHETVQRVFNEIFVLMVNPALDKHFQNPDTGRLKEHFVFIVDNWPSEAPSNSLVQMWLVRLARVLKLKSVTQKSFVEYHSKRNPVERVHAVENRALSNEVFSSTAIHKDYVIGDQHHRENMEHMAGEVQNCLARTQYGKQPIVVQRGIGTEENFVFNDESPLVTFLGKSECRKNLDNKRYYPVKNNLWKEVTTLWDLDESYIGCYREDYQILQNRLEEEGGRTCSADKYSTTIINPDIQQEDITFQQQPVPDYVRWFNTEGELHYMPLEKVQKLVTEMIDGTPGAFLPSKVLEMTYKVFAHGIDTVLPYIAFLSWCTEDEVKQFYAEFKDRLDTKFQNDKEREYWCQHELYKNEDKTLKLKCRANKISGDGKKHELVKRLVEKLEEHVPPPIEKYDGQMSLIPTYVTETGLWYEGRTCSQSFNVKNR
jgi:hypothetical protein